MLLRRAIHSSARLMAPRNIERVTVIGGGLMGSGICQVIAQSCIKVNLSDISQQALENSRSLINDSLSRTARKKHTDSEADQKKFISDTLSNINFVNQGNEELWNVDLVLEAVVENMETKRQLFTKLNQACSNDVILVSNTSSLSIEEMADVLPSERRRNFAGLHFFNPVPQMKLVECISTSQTDPEVTETLLALCSRLDKTAVTCTDSPGFIVNRLLIPYLLEAMRMVERGDATAKDIDIAMRLGAGYPMGPLALADLIGLDTVDYIASNWAETRRGEIGVAFVEPVPLLKQMLKEGKLGKKSGEGFYKYDSAKM
ncbi:hypothetical protein BT69DRAFT_1263978 [Atractiella rhizophila]|nr:hypothetical protein BT69DRAFT_1263978 [Atractiella rhizophila]